MNGKFLLDTNIVIALFADDVAVKDSLAKADEVFLPSIVVGELYFGAQKSELVSTNLLRIGELIANSVVLCCYTETARRYGEIKSSLRVKGRPLPENDIWIAAIAMQHDLILVTRDAHFDEIDNLKIVCW